MRKKQVAVYLHNDDHVKIQAVAKMLGVTVNSLFENHAKELISKHSQQPKGE